MTPIDSQHGIEGFLGEVRKSVFFQPKDTTGSYESLLEWYRKRAPRARLFYRASGTLTILLGVALPILAVFGQGLPYKDLLISILAGSISLLTGISSFFRWDVAWRGYIQTEFTLGRLKTDWELAVAKARFHPDVAEGLKMAMEATEQFQTRTNEVVEAETKGYFTVQKFHTTKAEDQ